MDAADDGCGALYATYVAARDENAAGMRGVWTATDTERWDLDTVTREQLEDAIEAGDTEIVRDTARDHLFRDEETPALDGAVASLLGSMLYWFGYLASFVLFFRARSRDTIVNRLRWAYRTVGVDIRDTETVDGVDRTVFRCPYRNLGAGRWGQRRACHDVLDRVDDGYVTFLDRHRDIDYERPQACAASECCYSEVSER